MCSWSFVIPIILCPAIVLFWFAPNIFLWSLTLRLCALPVDSETEWPPISSGTVSISIATLRANYEKLAAAKVINLDTYQKDGPEFEESLGLLKGIKEENAELISKLEDMVDEAKIEEVIQANGLEARFADMYKDILGQIKLADGIASLKETDAKYDAYNDSLIAVLEYMKENKNEWFIENNTLKSKSQNFIDEYNDLVKKTNVEL